MVFVIFIVGVVCMGFVSYFIITRKVLKTNIASTPLADAYLKYGYANVTTKCIDPGTRIRIPSSDNDEIDKVLRTNNLSLKTVDAERIKEMPPEQIGDDLEGDEQYMTEGMLKKLFEKGRLPLQQNFKR